MHELKSLSVFFPCYNEEKNIDELVGQVLALMPSVTKDFEIILVNDGSRDTTADIIDRLAKSDSRIKAVHHDRNYGYGRAVRSGFEAATKEWVFFSDSDLQFDLSELKTFIPHAQQYDAILGYRMKRAEGFGRARNAFLFKMFVNLLFQVNVKDIDCAFKLIKNSYMQRIRLTSSGAVISTELLYKLRKAGARRKELPVHHYLRQHGIQTGANLKVIMKAGVESLKLFYKVRVLRQILVNNRSATELSSKRAAG